MTKRIVAFAVVGIGLVAGPALAQGEGGCNWGAYFQSATADAETTTNAPVVPEDARG